MPRLYVGRLNQRVGERELRRFFEGYGKIRDIMMKNGYAFLDFDDYRDADDAVYELNGKELLGDRVMIEHAKGIERGVGGAPGGYRSSDRSSSGGGSYYQSVAIRKQRAREKYGLPVRTKYQVRIENLSSRVSWQDLKDYIRPHAEVTYADAHRKERNVATVCVSSRHDLNNLLRKMDGVELNGRRIKIIDESGGSKSRSRSRSRSRRRSRSRSSSRSRSRSKSGSRSKSRSRSKDNRRSASKSRSKSLSRSKSRSPSPKNERGNSRSRSQSRSRSKSKSRSRSQSARSRSKSGSPRD